MKKETHGVFLARMQPFHIAHLFLIEKALKENDKLTIVLGSANKKDMIRNPFNLQQRIELLHKVLLSEGYTQEHIDRITVFELPDWGLENDLYEPEIWGRYLYYNVVSRIQNKEFTIYYSDDAAIIKSWFNSEVKDKVKLRLFNRSNVYEGLSATRIREAIIADDQEYLKKFIPRSIFSDILKLKDHYEKVLKNPREDFRMK